MSTPNTFPSTEPTSRYGSFDRFYDFIQSGKHVCLTGDLDDVIINPENDKQHPFEEWLLACFIHQDTQGEIMAPLQHKLVFMYDAALKRLSLADNYLFDVPDDVSAMSITLRQNTPSILVHGRRPSGDTLPPVDLLMTPGAIVTNEHNQADRILLELINYLEKQKIKTALIIKHPEHLVGPQGSVIDSSSAVAQSLFSDAIQKWHYIQCVCLDAHGSFAKQVPEFAKCSESLVMLGNTKSDVLRLIPQGYELSETERQTIATLGIGLRTNTVLDLFTRYKTGCDIIQHLIRARTKNIVDSSGKLLEAEIIPFTEGTISLTKPAQEFWARIAHNFLERPDIVPSNILLVGPPGTGKSVAPKYLASLIGVPYIKLSNLGTEGLRGVALQKAMRVFETIEKNKPCVLHIDEIDKILPKHQEGWQSNNDEEVMAYVQDHLADADFMKGIIIIGTTNNPLALGDAMLRAGRFGIRIAMMPPENLGEKIAVFQAVWNQVGSLSTVVKPDERFLGLLLNETPEHATGADFRDRIEEAARLLFSSDSQESIHAHLATVFSRDFPRGERYDEMCIVSLGLHNAWSPSDRNPDGILTPAQEALRVTAFILDSLEASAAERDRVLEECRTITGDMGALIASTTAEIDTLLHALQTLPEEIRIQMEAHLAQDQVSLSVIQGEREEVERRSRELQGEMQRNTTILEQTKTQLGATAAECARLEVARRDLLLLKRIHTSVPAGVPA